MDSDGERDGRPGTVWGLVRAGWRRARARRPASFYLLLAILVVVLIGSPIAYGRHNPKAFAFLLTLNFVFFFVVLARAVVDFIEIYRQHFGEQEHIFRETLGDEEFLDRLGRRGDEEREE